MTAPFRLPMPPTDDDDEGRHDDGVSHVGKGADQRRGQRTGNTGQSRADEHGQAGGVVEGNALQHRRFRVLRAGPECPAQFTAAQKETKCSQQDDQTR